MKKRLAIVCFSDFTKEPRVLRTISALKDEYQITVYSNGNTQNGVTTIDVLNLDKDFELKQTKIALIDRLNSVIDRKVLGHEIGTDRYYRRKFWNGGRLTLLELINKNNFDVVIGHGIYTLPIIAKLSSNTVKIFNAHEFYEREFEENPSWLKYSKPYYEFLLNNYLHKVDLMLNVCGTIQKDYTSKYKVNSVLMTNAREFVDQQPGLPDANKKIKLVHHGAALRGRKLEKTIEVIRHLPDNYELTVILMPADQSYYNELKQTYAGDAKIKFIDPVNMKDIPALLNQFDIGLYILDATNYNNIVALPNKFFDFIQARLCIAVSPNNEMKEHVIKYGLGVVADDYTSENLAAKILSLSSDAIYKHKLNADQCARELSAEHNYQILSTSIKELLDKKCAA